MKIYTEEQVMKAYNMGIDDGHNGAISLKINELSLTPIELSSDEEIEKYIEKTFYGEKKYYFKAGIDFIKQTLIRKKND